MATWNKRMGKVLRDKGFDKSTYNTKEGSWSIGCSQCEALVINGIPAHERGCPNHVKEED